MSRELSEAQNAEVGLIAAVIEGIILQPTLYWKNARAQGLPFTMDPRIVYRGTAASIFNECLMLSVQFGMTSVFQKQQDSPLPQSSASSSHPSTKSSTSLSNSPSSTSSALKDLTAAALGGLATSLITSPVELVMIQQQMFGGSIFGVPMAIIKKYGLASNGMSRGLSCCMARDAIYVAGMLGVTPILQTYLKENGSSENVATLGASMIGGVIAAIPSHPFDVIKTCMQGDLKGERFTSSTGTLRYLLNEGGIKRVFSGCMWRTINITATVYIANLCSTHLPSYIFEGKGK